MSLVKDRGTGPATDSGSRQAVVSLSLGHYSYLRGQNVDSRLFICMYNKALLGHGQDPR